LAGSFIREPDNRLGFLARALGQVFLVLHKKVGNKFEDFIFVLVGEEDFNGFKFSDDFGFNSSLFGDFTEGGCLDLVGCGFNLPRSQRAGTSAICSIVKPALGKGPDNFGPVFRISAGKTEEPENLIIFLFINQAAGRKLCLGGHGVVNEGGADGGGGWPGREIPFRF